MYKLLLVATLLIASLSAKSAVVLEGGETFTSSFTLVSDGGAFKETDFNWDVGILLNFDEPSAAATFTAYEDALGSQEVFSSPIFGLFSGNRSFLGSNQDLFSDRNGSFSITNTGSASIELVDVVISNFAGNILPSNVATATITPSPVPLPAAVWLFASALFGIILPIRRLTTS